MKIRVVKVYEKELTPHTDHNGVEWVDESYSDTDLDVYGGETSWFERKGYGKPTLPVTKENVQDAIAFDHNDADEGEMTMTGDLGYEIVEERWEILDDAGFPVTDKRPEGFKVIDGPNNVL